MEEPENILSKIFNYINCSPSRNSAAELETKNIKRDLYDQPIQNTMNGFSSKAQMLHNPKLREANKRFLQMYPDQVEDDIEITSKTVKFSNDPTIILEPENLAEELQLARIGEFAARQADRERMERLLGPILTETHRKNVYRRIYGQPLYE